MRETDTRYFLSSSSLLSVALPLLLQTMIVGGIGGRQDGDCVAAGRDGGRRLGKEIFPGQVCSPTLIALYNHPVLETVAEIVSSR